MADSSPLAIEALYLDHHRWLQAWLARRLSGSHRAADLAHDTFLRVLSRRDPADIDEPRAYLTTIAQRVLANHWRREVIERAYMDALAQAPQAHAISPEARAVLLETLLEIDGRLDGLSGVARKAFLLSRLDGLGHADIAAELGISTTTVKRHLVRATAQCEFGRGPEARDEVMEQRLQLAATLPQVARAALALPRRVSRRHATRAVLIVAFTGGGAAWLRTERPWQAWQADATTRVGERRRIRLADGTRVHLNTDTRIAVDFGARERRVSLLRGEILVTSGSTGPHAGLPLVVATAHGRLRPVGTRFCVRDEGPATRVDVEEGAVIVHPGDGASPTMALPAGRRVRFDATGFLGAPVASDEQHTAWTDGMVMASGMRLADLLKEVARHRPGRIDCAPAIAELRVSGTYPLDDTDRILDALPGLLPVTVRRLTRYWIRLGSRA